MIQKRLDTIRDLILQKNNYFVSGYSDIVQSENGIIRNNTDIVFPSDTDGDYFYLRQPQTYQFTNEVTDMVSACQKPTIFKGDVVLVAFVRNADANILANNLFITIRDIDGVLVKSAVLQPEIVTANELNKMGKEKVSDALKRLHKSITLVSMTFSLEVSFNNKCVVNPCSC